MSELKPCPFCGGEAVPVYSDKGSLYTSNIQMLSKRGTVKCKKCEVRLPRIYSRVSKAIEVWNKRAEPSRPPEPQWNNHTVACLLADLYGDPCACNYNGIDEWLPSKCELLDACPDPVGVACWEQFLKHRAERRTDEQDSE